MDEIFESLELEAGYKSLGDGSLRSCYQVSTLAEAAFGAVGQAIAGLCVTLGMADTPPSVTVDRVRGSRWYGYSIQPVGWVLPPIWDAIAGDYPCRDGWVKLHTNLEHHREAALKVLDVAADRETVAQALLHWDATALETAVTEAGGVAAAMRSVADWAAHPQGRAVAAEPLIDWVSARPAAPKVWPAKKARPLSGLKVLDLTRVLAGPVATRTLAGYGAEVLRLDPPGWEEANVVPDVTLGKRCARLDLTKPEDRACFETLLGQADVLVHGYRHGALAALGYGLEARQALAPGLIEVSLNAYGWTGPWAKRRGFDSLVQMACGIADAGRAWANESKPTPLPVQALDHATGYLMAAAVIQALARAARGQGLHNARLSLARTAVLLKNHPQRNEGRLSLAAEPTDFSPVEEATPWGPARRLKPALSVENCPMYWARPAADLGSSAPEWSG